jgi:hypothetical protein
MIRQSTGPVTVQRKGTKKGSMYHIVTVGRRAKP